MKPRSVEAALQRRNAQFLAADEMWVHHCHYNGEIQVMGEGTNTQDLEFPVTFVEKPIFLHSWEVDVDHLPAQSAAEVRDCVVVAWKIDHKADGRKFYTGCTVAIKCVGDASQRAHVHFCFQGQGFQAASQTDLSDDALSDDEPE